MAFELSEYLIVTLDDLLYPPSPDTAAYWSICEHEAALLRERGTDCQVERVRLTNPNWSMDWLGIGIVKQEALDDHNDHKHFAMDIASIT